MPEQQTANTLFPEGYFLSTGDWIQWPIKDDAASTKEKRMVTEGAVAL